MGAVLLSGLCCPCLGRWGKLSGKYPDAASREVEALKVTGTGTELSRMQPWRVTLENTGTGSMIIVVVLGSISKFGPRDSFSFTYLSNASLSPEPRYALLS